jgi:AhpD family alkylhydroperoxidase
MTSTNTFKLQMLLAATVTGGFIATATLAHTEGAASHTQADIAQTIGFVPGFAKAMPANALPGIWEETKAFELSNKTALDGKTKDLIGLAIAAQLPSRLTAWSYGKAAEANGASEAELHEAVVISALARHWSTFFNGMQIDEAKYRGEVARLRDNVTKAMAAGATPPPPVAITDAKSVFKDAEQSFGFVPDFLRRFPAEALPGAWLNFRDVEMSPSSALPGKTKTLIGLAVASQIPCRYCVISDTEFAKLEGATEREIAEAVTMGAMARQFITLVEGLGVDEKTYHRDWERMLSGLPKKTAAATNKSARVAKAE